jgi:uncharacterized protein (TIGR03086 family)
MNTTATTTTQIDQLRHVTAAVTALVEHATPDELLHDSPCAGWSGRDVLNHMVGGADWFAGPARGEEVPFPNWSAMPDWLGADPVHSYRAAADRAIDAYAAPGVLDGNVVMPWGEMPAAMALNLLIADQVTHAWDLERTTGVPMNIDEAVIKDALATSIAGVTQALRDAGFYGPEVAAPAGAPAVQRLAAFTGRKI